MGGRWHENTHELLRSLAKLRVANVHLLMRRSVELFWTDRWWAILGVAVQDGSAASILAPSGRKKLLDTGAAEVPNLNALLDGQRWAPD